MCKVGTISPQPISCLEGKQKFMELISLSLQALTFFLLLIALAALWITSARRPGMRPFWTLLALAWTMNLLGFLAWVAHDLFTSSPLNSFSIGDIFFITHYVLIAFVFWRYPASLPRRAWLWTGIAMLAAALLVWAVYFDPSAAPDQAPWIYYLGLAFYPILDAGLVTLGAFRVRAARDSAWAGMSLWLFSAVASYALANTLNVTGTVFASIPVGFLPDLFWAVTNALIVGLTISTRKNPRTSVNAG
jgi:hypothetical protein